MSESLGGSECLIREMYVAVLGREVGDDQGRLHPWQQHTDLTGCTRPLGLKGRWGPKSMACGYSGCRVDLIGWTVFKMCWSYAVHARRHMN